MRARKGVSIMKRMVHKSIVVTYSFLQIMRGENQMIEDITPCEEVENILSIDFDKLIMKGYFNYIFDIDNTVVPACSAKISEEVCRLFSYLKALDCNICLVSNNPEIIVGRVAKKLDVPFISHASKPFAKAYKQALTIIDGNKDNTAFIGDQMITDIAGANRIGLYTILTGPINKNSSALVYLTTIPQSIIKKRYDKIKRLALKP